MQFVPHRYTISDSGQRSSATHGETDVGIVIHIIGVFI